LGMFADEVLDAVAGICGDAVVENHTQAAGVLEALCKRPGTDQRELAAVFGLTREQLGKSREFSRRRSEGKEAELREKDAVWASLCNSDAVYTWNVLIERINHAAHWREEFRELANEDDDGASASSDDEPTHIELEAREAADESKRAPPKDEGESESPSPAKHRLAAEASRRTREKAQELMAKHLDPAPEALRRRLARRLDAEIFERCPSDRDYRHLARTIVANLKRNTMLAAGYATGRVPPQWLVLADAEALAPRLTQLGRRCMRSESSREALEDDETVQTRRRMWAVAKGQDLQPPPHCEDILD